LTAIKSRVGNGRNETGGVTVFGSSAAAAAAEKAAGEAKSPAYSDISDDNDDERKRSDMNNGDGSTGAPPQAPPSSHSVGNLVSTVYDVFSFLSDGCRNKLERLPAASFFLRLI